MTDLPIPPAGDWLSLSRLEQVLYLASLGYKILPVHGIVNGACTCGVAHDSKSNLAGKHPTISEWVDRATSDPTQLTSWFQDHDELNYGIFMAGSGFLAIDIDVKGGGWESWWSLYFACEGDLPPTVQVSTGKNVFMGEWERGAHMYFLAPDSVRFPANLSNHGLPSIDLRHNAYVLGPGSMHKSGIRYMWESGHAPWEIEVAEIPEIAKNYLSPKPAKRVRTDSDSSIGDEAWRAKWTELSTAEVNATAYASAALKNAVREISEMMPASGRNNAINAKAFSLGRLIGGGQLSLVEARAGLRKAAEKAYKNEFAYKCEAVEKTLRTWGGGFETGAMEPVYQQEVSEETMDWIRKNFSSTTSSPEDVIATAHQGFFRGQELQRLELQQAVISFGPIEVGPGKTLWSYSDGYWKRDGRDHVVNRTGHLLGNKARRAHTDALLHFMETEPQTIKGLGPEGFLNLQNGMLNWSTHELKPHDKSYYSTVQLPLLWNPAATCETVDSFLDQVLHEDLIELIWEIIGICIFTGMGFQQAIFFDGGGRNGKGTLVRLIERLIPQEFVSHIELQSFASDKFAKAQLFNKILNVVGDLSPKALADTSLFKQLTGQDTISADYKYGQTFDFKNEATLLFAANELPYSSDNTHGFFERLLIVPFDKVTLEKHDIDHSLESRMALELEGVLVKAVEGLRRAKGRGYLLPVERCEQALATYRLGSAWLGSWASNRVQFTDSGGDRLNRATLYESYKQSCLESGKIPMSSGDFYSAFEAQYSGVAKPLHVGGHRVFTNLRITEGY